MIAGLGKVLRSDETINEAFQGFVGGMLNKAIKLVGWEAKADDKHLTKLMRGTIIGMLSSFNPSDEVVGEAQKRFDAMVADPSDAAACPSEYRTSVFKIVLKKSGDKEAAVYDSLHKLFQAYDDNAEKKRILHSLGCAPSAAYKVNALDWASSGAVKLQDFFYTIGSVAGSNLLGADIAFKYLQDNLDKYKAMLGTANSSLMNAVLVNSCSGLATVERADEIEAFFKANPMPSNQRRIVQLLERLRTTAKLLKFIQNSEAAKPEFWTSL